MGANARAMAVYLLHFDRPYRHAKHYLGFAEDARLEARIAEHRRARPADGRHHRLMEVVRAAGITFTVARVWPGADRSRERQLKNNRGAKHCPICREERRRA